MDRPAPLDRDAWLRAALRALADDGPAAVKAETLARRLKVTKGSFYWHFTDFPDFRDRLLDFWEDLAYRRFLDALTGVDDPLARLRMLTHLAVTCGDADLGGPAMEPALRAWARVEPAVAARVAHVDRLRLAEIARMAMAVGLSPEDGDAIYAAILGFGQLSEIGDPARVGAMNRLLDALTAGTSA